MISGPTVLVIERSQFPAGIATEECIRSEKLGDEEAIVRFQRHASQNIFERIGRFFSDLVNGVTKVHGHFCQRGSVPDLMNIRGEWCVVQDPKKTAASSPRPAVGAAVAGAGAGAGAGDKVIFRRMRVEFRDAQNHAKSSWDPIVLDRISEELNDRFQAYAIKNAQTQEQSLVPVTTFLDWQARRDAPLKPAQVTQLASFRKAFDKFADELSDEVRQNVRQALDLLQQRIDADPQLKPLADQAGWYGPPPPPPPAAPPPPPGLLLTPAKAIKVKASGADAAASRPAAKPAVDSQSEMMAQLKAKLGAMRKNTGTTSAADKEDEW